MLDRCTPPRAATIFRILALFVLMIMLAAPGYRRAQASALHPLPPVQGVQGALQHLPLSFEVNQGQADKRVNFIASASGFGLELTANEADFSLLQGRRTASIKMRISGGNAKAAAIGQKPLPGRMSYFIGKYPKRWHSNIPTYQAVKYTGVYKGIDLVYYGNQQHLEYDFVIAPGANPQQISLSFGGARASHIDKKGDLTLDAAGGPLLWRRPVAYQESYGKRTPVAAVYRTLPNGRIGFQLGRYDTRRPLTIDPSLIYSTLLSGPGYVINSPDGLAVDSFGNVFIFGMSDLSRPQTDAAAQAKYGNRRLFIAKLNAMGNTLLYLAYFGSNGEMRSGGIAVDADGDAYLTGATTATDFPVTGTGYRTTGGLSGADLKSAGADIFLTKLDPTGTKVLYATYFGGAGWERELTGSVAVDKAGNAYINGLTQSLDLPVVGGFQTAHAADNGVDSFFAKFDTTKAGAASLVYSTYIGGTGTDIAWGVATDEAGNAYVSGNTTATDFPVTPGAAQTVNHGAADAYVVKINTNATGPSSLVYSTYVGGSGQEVGFALAVDSEGCAYIAGGTESADFPVTAGALQQTYGGTGNARNGYIINGDAFVVKLSPNGASRLYSTYLGGSGTDFAVGIVVDGAGHAYVSGNTESDNFPVRGGLKVRRKNSTALFIDKLSAGGNALCYGTFLGGSGGDMGGYAAVDVAGREYVTGLTLSHDFPVTPGALATTSFTGLDGFVTALPTTFAADFNHDGTSDLVMQDEASGEIWLWYMAGSTVTRVEKITPNPPAGWTVAGVGYFDGDPDPDIVLQNAAIHQVQVWHMHGNALAASANITAALPEGSSVVAVGDFNGDSRPDLVLQNQATGAAEIWFLKDTTVIGTSAISPTPPAGFRIAGAGYFDSDGLSDLVLENASTHQVAIWLMKGAAEESSGLVAQAIPDGWHVAGAADTDGSGWPKIVLQDSATGQVDLWTLTGAAVSDTATVNVKPAAGLHVVAL